MKPPDSVGVDSMDDEHKECTDSFNRAIKDPTSDTLQELYEILKAHFDHEEELIETYYGGKSSSFSALNSHRMDHERILKIATTELERVADADAAADAGRGGGGGGGGGNTTCSLQQGGRD